MQDLCQQDAFYWHRPQRLVESSAAWQELHQQLNGGVPVPKALEPVNRLG